MYSVLSESSKQGEYEFLSLASKMLPGILVCIFLLLYFLPNGIESLFLQRGAPPVVFFVFGDLVGCAAIKVLLNRRWALGIYLMSSAMECGLFYCGTVSLRTLIWITDLVPAIVIAMLVTHAAYRGRNWRPSIRAIE